MSRLSCSTALGAVLSVAMCVPAAAAGAQAPTHVRVVNAAARIQCWYRPHDVCAVVDPGTALAVLDKEGTFYWVMLPADAYGTRKAGWIRSSDVEPFTEPPQGQDEHRPVATASPATDAPPPGAHAAEDVVTITERRDDSLDASRKAYAFEDVHFDRDRSSIRAEDVERLRAAISALERDPSLVVNIQGYTCSLGTKTHNRALGSLRANAVKDYLVSEGVAPDRLQTVSLGEEHPMHDNSREETRRLNRRVALVPDARP
jgi:peptidoglycan-associated lipoprotein